VVPHGQRRAGGREVGSRRGNGDDLHSVQERIVHETDGELGEGLAGGDSHADRRRRFARVADTEHDRQFLVRNGVSHDAAGDNPISCVFRRLVRFEHQGQTRPVFDAQGVRPAAGLGRHDNLIHARLRDNETRDRIAPVCGRVLIDDQRSAIGLQNGQLRIDRDDGNRGDGCKGALGQQRDALACRQGESVAVCSAIGQFGGALRFRSADRCDFRVRQGTVIQAELVDARAGRHGVFVGADAKGA